MILRLDKRFALGADDLQYAVKELKAENDSLRDKEAAGAAGLAALRKDFEAFRAARLPIVLMLTLNSFATSPVFSPLAMRWRASFIWWGSIWACAP
jgi:hypothetical protein